MMGNFANTIDVLGDEATAKAIIERTITEFNDDTLTNIGQYAFYRCEALNVVNLPNVDTVSDYSFGYCSAITRIVLPKLSSSIYFTFKDCKALTEADIGNCSVMSTGCFANCSNLKTIVLRKNTICTLVDTNCFNSTPFASGGTGGTVYVPQALITAYQTATNWSTLYAAGTCNFVAIEGSEYE